MPFWKKIPKTEELSQSRTYDYSSPEGRCATAEWLFGDAKAQRSPAEREWMRCNDYYNFIHNAPGEIRDYLQENNLDWEMAVVPEPFVAVESLLDPKVPEPQFTGRDTDMDSELAKEREFAVKYMLEANKINDLNTSNERRLRKLGDAFWKAYWDPDMMCGPFEGDVHIIDVPLESLYIDPTAGNDGIQSAQYINYVYRPHKVAFYQMFAEDLKKQGLTLDDIQTGDYSQRDSIFDLYTTSNQDDTIQVLEHWFKQPYDTEDAPAGSIACSIQAGGKELRFIPNYWEKTGRQCKLFPFVHYWCIRDENQFYNKSELYPIFSLVDAADRELNNAQVNSAMMANDMILVEEGALVDGEEITNEPGSVVRLNRNCMGKVQRMGGIHSGNQAISMIEWYIGQTQRANRNYDTNQGKESSKITTASGLLQLRSDADTQNQIKKADRNAGFARLFELLDWLALEYYDDNRLLFIGAKNEHDEPQKMQYNGDKYSMLVPPVADMVSGEIVRESYQYYPKVDVMASAGDGIARSKAATLEVLDKLAAANITAENYQILTAELEILDLPQKKEITEMWQKQFAPIIPPEITQALEQDPNLLAQVSQMIQQAQMAQQQMQGSDVNQIPQMQGQPMPAGMGGMQNGMPQM